ncbi:MAG: glycerol-3-phosphate 1-O-acyltransferase PlsY [Sphingomonadaceae bacterium]|uniref:glycerol-3-phosphate 1-O-acyltransferase PlsY n=1 Tax=Thermaurantiacus sp. TaxID=2820283 RepID=UPI00298F1165|nr:glycerol-3-phosphate 1-O-acyltransferase PlsY [Thermaurantiacus sp.]MCS6986360.1 glycerol-3-phosphate 1-O-acyltransferase PlsY [Sphingomonadaceae bacterium]MDW8414378.1 glycerol-3-phosphate 1-O-acyltransferase PlsY [Thermaurantiacus sp.]
MELTLALGLGYLLGSLPFGLLLVRWAGAGDIRTMGSGNIGATNVLRTGRRDLAILTLVLDAGKGALAVLLAREALGPGPALAAAGAAVVGHVWPVWLGFRGGKGVATFLGVALALVPPAGLAFAAAWLLVALATRISSAGGMTGGFAATIVAGASGQIPAAGLFLALSALVLWTHRANIRRLRAGTEPRIGQR